MRKKKFLALILTVAMGLFLFAGCGNNSDKNDKKEAKNPKEINVTYVKAPLNVPSILEKNDKLFEKEFSKDGIGVKFHEITSGPDQTAALAAGELDFLHALGGTSAILAASNGVDLKILNVYSRAPKGFMILTKDKKIKSVKDLKGKKIAGPKGTVLHQLLVSALDKNGMSIKDVKFVNMGIPEASAALSNGSVDAALLAGPAALKAENNGAKLVVNGEGLVDGTIVTAVSGKFLNEHPDLVKRFEKVHNETIEYMKKNKDKVIKETAKEVGLTDKETREMYSWYNFDPQITKADIKDLEKTQDFLIKNGMQKKKIDINSIIFK